MNKDLIAKLEKWLGDEPDISKLSSELSEDEYSKYTIITTYRGYPINIVFSQERIDSFLISGTVTLNSAHIYNQIELYDLNLRKQMRFDLQHEFSQYTAEFRSQYDDDSVLQSIHFSRVLWEDGLNKNIFFKAMIDIVVSKVRSINYINLKFN